MTIPKILICSLPSLAGNIRDTRPGQVVTLIDPHPKHNSDLDEVASIQKSQPFEWLRLFFADVEGAADPDGPKWRHVEQVVQWAQEGVSTIVCCNGGVARSSATAIGLMCSWGLPPDKACEVAWSVKGSIWPNSLIVRMFDQMLKLNGTLVDACSRAKGIPRCPDCCQVLLAGLDDHECPR
jgi:predicted protein tyrosine phosphatase